MKPRLFDEIVEGFQSFADHRAGKITLNTYVVEVPDPPTLTAQQILALRNKLTGTCQAECTGDAADSTDCEA